MEKAPIFRHLRRKTGGNQKCQSWVKSGFKLAGELFFWRNELFPRKGFQNETKVSQKDVDKFEKSTFWRVLEPQFLRTGSIIKEDFEVTTQILPEICNKSVFEDWLQKSFAKIRFHIPLCFFSCFFLKGKWAHHQVVQMSITNAQDVGDHLSEI